MEDEPVGTVEAPVATSPVPEGQVDVAPNPLELQAEIERLAQVKAKAEEDAKYWRKQKAEARADFFKSRTEPEPVASSPVIPGAVPPRKDDFDDYDKYVDALTEFKTNAKIAEFRQEEARKAQDSQVQQRQASLQVKLEKGFEDYADFEEVALDRTVPINNMVAEILAESENPHHLAYYLGKNRAEAIAISRMNPIQATRRLAQIEAEINQAGPTKGQGGKKIIPSADAPIKPLGSANQISKDPSKMSQKEYEIWRESMGARRF